MLENSSPDTQKFSFDPEQLRKIYKMSETFNPQEEDLPLHSEIVSLDFRYDIEDVVSQGGEKDIFRAKDVQTNRYIALAKLRKNCVKSRSKREEFLREARLTAALQHPNIMPVYDLGFDENHEPFFTMRLMKGTSLDDLIENKEAELPELLTIFIKICDAISYAHSKGIVHLDLKPENILLGKFGEVLVADWGISKIANERVKTNTVRGIDIDSALLNSITATGVVKGTPGYLAPEQMDTKFGRKNEKTDIFSLGAILFKILTGKKAIRAQTLNNYKKQLLEGVIPPSKQFPKLHLDKSLEAVCMKAMALNPNSRYSDVRQIIADIQAFQNGYMTTAESGNTFKQSLLFIKRNKVVVTIAALILSSVITVMQQRIESLESAAKLLAQKEKFSEEVESRKSYFSLTMKKNLISLSNSVTLKHLSDTKEMYEFLKKENPDSDAIKIVNFKILFIEQQFSKALNSISREGLKEEEQLYYQLAEKYKDRLSPSGKLPIKEVINLMNELKESGITGSAGIARLVGTFAFIRTNRNNVAEMLITELINLYGVATGNLNITVDKRGDSYLRVELNNRRITSIKGIQFLPITDLNIRRTNIKGVKVASAMPLRKLVIGKKVTDLRPLGGCKTLKTLVIESSGTNRPYLDELRDMGVEVIVE